MNRHILILLGVVAFLSGCVKFEGTSFDAEKVRIGITRTFGVDTKTTPVTEIPSTLYWGVTQGSPGSELSVRAPQSGSVVDGYITTDISSHSSYNYYVANQSFSISAAATTATVLNTSDFIWGRTGNDSSSNPVVTLYHAFGRTGSLSVDVPSGVSVVSSSWKIHSKDAISGTSGVFNLTTGAFISSTASLPETALTSSSDLYLIPGVYTVTCDYMLSYSGSENEYSYTGDVTIQAGKVLAITLDVDLNEISFSVNVTPWDNLPMVASLHAPLTFSGLKIAPGNLYYDGSEYKVASSPLDGLSSYGSTYGQSAGSYYHSWTEMASVFANNGAGTGDNLIAMNNSSTISSGGTNWRMPTRMEIEQCIFGTVRKGSSVNGVAGRHYAFAVVTCPGTGLSTSAGAQSSYPSGYQLGVFAFPDGGEFTTSASFAAFDAHTLTTGVTKAQYDELIAQGAVFFPCTGYYFDTSLSGSGWGEPGLCGVYWDSTCYNTASGHAPKLKISDGSMASLGLTKGYHCNVRLVSGEPEWLLPGEFSVSSTKRVRFSKGNLQAYIGSTVHDTYVYDASSWRFAIAQWDWVGNSSGNTDFAMGSMIDLFSCVGASATYQSYGVLRLYSYNGTFLGSAVNEALKTEWGSIPGVVTTIGGGYRALTQPEMYYLLNLRAGAASKKGQARLYNGSSYINGLLILPDNWVAPAGFSFTSGNGPYTRNTYSLVAASGTANAWCDIEAAGAVFLVAAGYSQTNSTVTGSNTTGWYWYNNASTSGANLQTSYILYITNGSISDQNPAYRYSHCAVRLVKDAN